MTKKPKSAILPSDMRDPTGVDSLERRAMRDFAGRMRRVLAGYKAALGEIPVEPAVNRRYSFRLDTYLLRSLMARLDQTVRDIILEGGEDNLWIFEQYIEVASRRGTAQAFANLGQQSAGYRSERMSMLDILRSDPHRRRMALLNARVYEEMRGLGDRVRTDMARVLTEGIGRGQNPRVIAKQLTEQAGIETRRANMLARTEITSALRRARWDEADDAEALYGLKTMEMHLSALSPTTRLTHAARHAKLYTREQVRDWWGEDGNSVNCKCTTVSVMVDADGKPVAPSIVDRARLVKQRMEGRDYPWAEKEKHESKDRAGGQ